MFWRRMNDPAPSPALAVRYQFKAMLGQGGAGEVLTAWDTQLKRTVAIKRLHHAARPDEDIRNAWQEAMCLASIRHPNIVSVFDIGTDRDVPYMVMEFVQGETLEQTVRRGPLPVPVFCEIARQCLDGIAAAHHSGLVHRDLKPANIMLVRLPTGQYQVKILDFGIAQYLQGQREESSTPCGSVTGTVHWISPEQLEGGPVDARSDLYALGCVFYFALAGLPPFSGKTANEVLQAHLAGHATPLSTLRPEIPQTLSRWVGDLIARDPDARPLDAIAALDGLDAVAGVRQAPTQRLAPTPEILADEETGRIDAGFLQPPPAAGVDAPSPPRRWTSALIAATALVAAIGGAFLFLQKPAEPVFRIHGSNTIGSKLAPALVEGYLARKGHREIQIRSTPQSVERQVEFTDASNGRRSRVEIHAHGSRTAFSGLRDLRCDLGMSSSPVKDGEAKMLSSQGLGDMRSPACEHVAGLDGLAILVHPSNPVAELDRKKVAAIFEGKITDWSEAGRPRPGPIRLHARDANSGTFDSFQSMVLGAGALSPSALRYEDSTELSRAVATDPDAIGFAGLPYILDCKALAIGDGESPAQIPSRFTVATEDYALSRRLYFYAPESNSHQWTREFLEFVASSGGQDIVSREGFVKQTPAVQPGLLPARAPERYKQLLEGAERVSLNVRFTADASQPDTKAQRDLSRLVELMALPENRGREVVLVGFHEDTGTPGDDLAASLRNATTVAAELERRGLQARHVEGFGSSLPVASNSDETGRRKNRRVEIWIRHPLSAASSTARIAP